jgi:ABC-type antimicrobial peptide transport system ATPase subunit
MPESKRRLRWWSVDGWRTEAAVKALHTASYNEVLAS